MLQIVIFLLKFPLPSGKSIDVPSSPSRLLALRITTTCPAGCAAGGLPTLRRNIGTGLSGLCRVFLTGGSLCWVCKIVRSQIISWRIEALLREGNPLGLGLTSKGEL